MKKYLVVLLCLISLPVFADHAPHYRDGNNIAYPNPITLEYYGCPMDNSTNCTTAWQSARAAAQDSGYCIRLDGIALISQSQGYVDIINSVSSSAGICITGAGWATSGMNFQNGSTQSGPAFKIYDSFGSGIGILNVTLDNFAIFANTAGPALQLGSHDFSDAINSSHIVRMGLSNANSASTCQGVEVNFVLNSSIEVISNCGSASQGDSFTLRQSQFNNYYGSMGNALYGIHWKDSASFGDTFHSLDNEATNDFYNDSTSTSFDETILGGQFSFNPAASGHGIISNAGSGFMFINPSFGSTSNQLGTATGVCLLGGHNLPGSYTSCATGGGGSGTVTSVAAGTGMTGGTITSSGTIGLSSPVSVANGGTGTASPGLVAGTNVTVTGSWPNQTIASSGGSGGSETCTFNSTNWYCINSSGHVSEGGLQSGSAGCSTFSFPYTCPTAVENLTGNIQSTSGTMFSLTFGSISTSGATFCKQYSGGGAGENFYWHMDCH